MSLESEFSEKPIEDIQTDEIEESDDDLPDLISPSDSMSNASKGEEGDLEDKQTDW